jgi:signal transduction histidine kinase
LGSGDGEGEGIDPVVERLVVDLSDLARAETELRLARRLEAAGRLAAEMAPEIEAALDNASTEPAAQSRASLLVRQLMAFSRNQAKPAGLLSLNDAINRSESLLRQITGVTIDLRIVTGDVEPVAAGEEDIERLLVELVTAAAACLPFGGRLTIETSLEPHSTFVLRTTLTATAAGYGVLPCTASSSLVRFAALCGGSVRTSDTAGRTSTLHVHLP